MKSPLVDALRQAKDQSDADGSPAAENEPVRDDQRAAQPTPLDDTAPEAPEFELLDATDVLVVEQPAADAEDDDYASDADGSARSEMLRQTFAVGPAAIAVPAGAARPPTIARLGRYSPLLALLLAASTAALYFGYQVIGGGAQNVDLAALSTQVGKSAGPVTTLGAGPQGPVNHFPLIVSGANEAARRDADDVDLLLANEGNPE